MKIDDFLDSQVKSDEFGVWILKDHGYFNYSDGSRSESYLNKAFTCATDLSSKSSELESWIKDWPSEYHLSQKRAQLLSGFNFDTHARVLEVGCGCGAITRYLAEKFDSVIAVEGNINRARLARARNRDLDSVSIVCAPFQELRFKQKFDLIFCIGVFEYSGSFIDHTNPYQAALKYFSSLLSNNGILVLAIENQFGLKYFSNAREDHLGVQFAGIEGYHGQTRKVRTFGRTELHEMLRTEFQSIHFFYPYPDYKVPDCVASENFLRSGFAGELVSGFTSRDYFRTRRPLFDDRATTLEINRNRALEFFANSFLVIAGKGCVDAQLFPQELILYSSGRVPGYSTVTRAIPNHSGKLIFTKRKAVSNLPDPSQNLCFVGTSDELIDAFSILTQLLLRVKSKDINLMDLFSCVKPWFEELRKVSHHSNGRLMVSGHLLDAVWGNSYVVESTCRFIDLEWQVPRDIPLNVLVIRAIYDFLIRTDSFLNLPFSLNRYSGKSLIFDIAKTFGCILNRRDFDDFIFMEKELKLAVFGEKAEHEIRDIRWFLMHRPLRRFIYGLAILYRGFVARF